MPMHNPPHPGTILRDVLNELNTNVTDAARQLGVSRVQLSRFVNGRAGVSPELAVRLSKWIPAPTAKMWLQMQTAYDLWQVEHSGREFNVVPARQPA